MWREILESLELWRAAPLGVRKPLVLRGARQTGKSFIVRAFGSQAYRKVHVVDFRVHRNLREVFKHTLEPASIIRQLEFTLNETVDPSQDLVFFD